MNRSEKIYNAIKNKQTSLTIVFENISDPHNVSAVLRTCESVGLYEVYVIDNLQGDQKFNPGWRSSASAFKWLKIHYFKDITSCMEIVKRKFENIYATHLGEASSNVFNVNYTQSTAVILGNEIDGISSEMLKYCNGNIFIPQMGMIQSLNISVASAVILYEACRQRLLFDKYNGNDIDENTVQKLLSEWK